MLGRNLHKSHLFLCLLALSAAWLAGLFTPPHVAAQGDLAGTLIQLVNNYRAANGLAGWEVNGALASAAQSHANWVASTGQYGHSGEGGSSPQTRARAAGYSGIVYENYVYGTNLDPAGALQWWINSPVHLATLLSQTVHVGVGVVPGGRGTLYVLVAGRPESVRLPSSSDSGGGQAAAAEEEAVESGPVVVPIVLAEPDAQGNVIHIVQQGQTAWAIAARYGVPLDDVLDLNGFNLPVVLVPGDPVYIKLGPGQQPPPTATPPSLAVVQEGQTIWEIAMAQGLTVDELLELNGLTREDVIKPGDQLWLRLPEATPTAAPGEGAPGAPTANASGVVVMIFTPSPRPSNTPVLSPTPTSLLDALTASPPPPGAVILTPTPTPTASPTVPTVELTPSYGPIWTATPTGQAIAALSATGTPEPAASTPAPTAARADSDDGLDWPVVLGIAALGVVWVAVLGIGVVTWMGKRRG